MNRRFVLISTLAGIVSPGALAQDAFLAQAIDSPIKTPDELLYLVLALDTMLFIVTTEVLREPEVLYKARTEIQPYVRQLADPKGMEVFNAALESSEGQARIKKNAEMVAAATKRLDEILREAAPERLRGRITKAFSRSSTLLDARSGDNVSWWCHCYALRKIGC